MALILADRVRETSTTTGTGALSLAGAVVGYQTFSSAIGNTNTCYYAISNPGVAEWEVGIGTYATSGNTLTRTTIIKSSNANAAVNFSAGTKDVFVTYPAGKSVYQDASGNVTIAGGLGVGGSAAPGSTGLAVTGTLSATSSGSFTQPSSANTGLTVKSFSAAGGNQPLGVFQRSDAAVSIELGYDGGAGNSHIGTTTAHDFEIWRGGSVKATATSTGLAVTGTLSSTLDATIYGVTVGRGGGAVSTNTAVGASALAGANTGVDNHAFGYQALLTNTTGSFSTAFGSGSLKVSNANQNAAFGHNTLFGNTSGANNTAIGSLALNANTTASNNTAVGKSSLPANTTGASNTAVGTEALQANTTASNNTAVGYQALYSDQTTGNATAIGYQAGYSRSTNGDGNGTTFVGYKAGFATTTGADNAFFGANAGVANTTGGNNTAIGAAALAANTTASYNTAVGYQAAYTQTTGIYSVAMGYQALYSNTTGSYNVAIGRGALFTTTGSENTAVGQFALNLATTGLNNTAIGTGSGAQITSGSKNTIIGAYSGNQGGLDIRTASNYIVLSDGDGNPRGIFDSSGNFLVGITTGTSYKLSLKTSGASQSAIGTAGTSGDTSYQAILINKFDNDSTTSQNFIQFQINNGGANCGKITANGANTAAFGSTSDQRVKENIVELPSQLDNIMALRPVEFDYLESYGGGHQIGFIAQEIQAVYPDVISEDESEEKIMSITGWSKTEARLVKAIQEQQAIITALTTRITALEAK